MAHVQGFFFYIMAMNIFYKSGHYWTSEYGCCTIHLCYFRHRQCHSLNDGNSNCDL